MYRHSESTGAQSENLKNSPTYYIVSGGFDPIHEGQNATQHQQDRKDWQKKLFHSPKPSDSGVFLIRIPDIP